MVNPMSNPAFRFVSWLLVHVGAWGVLIWIGAYYVYYTWSYDQWVRRSEEQAAQEVYPILVAFAILFWTCLVAYLSFVAIWLVKLVSREYERLRPGGPQNPHQGPRTTRWARPARRAFVLFGALLIGGIWGIFVSLIAWRAWPDPHADSMVLSLFQYNRLFLEEAIHLGLLFGLFLGCLSGVFSAIFYPDTSLRRKPLLYMIPAAALTLPVAAAGPSAIGLLPFLGLAGIVLGAVLEVIFSTKSAQGCRLERRTKAASDSPRS